MRSRKSLFLGLVVVGALLAALVPAAQGAQTPNVAVQADSAAAEQVALAFVTSRAGTFGLSSSDVNDVVVADAVLADHTGVTSVHLQQRYRGIEIFGAVMNVAVDDQGDVVSAAGQFVPGLTRLAPRTAPTLSNVSATEAAAGALGLEPTSSFDRVSSAVGTERAGELSDGGVSLEDIPSRLVLQPVEGDVRLAWEITIYELDAENWWQIRVDAATGAELDRNNLVNSDSYNVYEQPVEAPTFGARTIAVNPADATASPFGWHDTDGLAGAEFTVTEGNNVTAYTDIDADNVMDPGSQADGGASLLFDFPLDLALDPSTYRDASVTNLFYWNNVLHDFFYAYGFDEAAGNFQTNTYGNGGLGNDAVRAEVQDGSAVNNANFATPADGFAPRMQMYRWDTAFPSLDSALDSSIVAHEYGHGVSNRLTGGPSNVTCLQNAEQAGEGWSDYFALMVTMLAGDAGSDSRGIATYSLGQPTTGAGLRDFPYSTNVATDPRTYDTIKTALVPHGVGSTFAAMLWDMTWDLIDRDGFDPDLISGTGGNITAMQLVMDGLTLQPCSPGFVDSRDAILLADQLSNAGANECLIWGAFAKRGLGLSADQGFSVSRSDGTEAFDVPANCEDFTLAKTATPDPAVPGQDVTYSLTATNNTTAPFTGVTITDPIPTGSVYVAGSATCGGTFDGTQVSFPLGTLAATSSIICSFAVTVDGGPGTVPRLTDDLEAGAANWGLTHGAGTADWALSTAAPRSPTSSMLATGPGGLTDQYLTTTTAIVASSNTVLRFWHNYDTDNTWDGGVVEASTDGVVWSDLGADFITNGYNATLNVSGNALSGRAAFTGNSAVYIESAIDLSGFAGSSVFLRFRFGTDEIVASAGWHVDDISIRDEVWLANSASATSTEGLTAVGSLQTPVTEPPGFLRVTTSPAVPSVIDVNGQFTDAFGLDWVETPVGAHEVCFADVPGFTTPSCAPAEVAAGATTTVVGTFVTHGTLDISSSPAVATTITVDGLPVNDWGAVVSIEPGTYTVCFGAAPDFDTPACQAAVVTAGATTPVVGTFVSNPGALGQTGVGFLRATTSPAVRSQFVVDGVRTVSYGVDWVKLTPGSYNVCFTDVPGFASPACQNVTITDGLTTTIQGVFDPLAGLRVATLPVANQPITVDGRTVDQYGFWTWVPAGVSYEICTANYTCQTVSPPAGVLTAVTLIP